MVSGWLTKLADRFVRKSKVPEQESTHPDDEGPSKGDQSNQSSSETFSNEEKKRWDFLLRPLPLGMFIIGALLTGGSELIGGWCILGYLLLVTSPIVYWLSRIEQRLAESLASDKDRQL